MSSSNDSCVSSSADGSLPMNPIFPDSITEGLQLDLIKPIRTGATLYSMAVTRRKLMFYKLYDWTYGGAFNRNIPSPHRSH